MYHDSGKRGPKPRPKALPREPLRAEPPPALRLAGRAKTVYKELAERLAAEGFSSMADSRTVALAATTVAMAERLEAEVAALPSLVLADGKLHPLVGELRQTKAALANLYGALFMTPRARSSSRMTEEQARLAALRSRQAGVGPRDRHGVHRPFETPGVNGASGGDDEESDDEVVRRLLGDD